MNLLRLTVNKDFALPNFLTHLLGICRSRGWLKALAARAVGQSSINQGKLKALLVPVPPLAEQADIASCLDAADSLISARERELDLLTELFNALLESLFSGQLSVEPVVRYEEHV
jgi:type I restriction enzyme S subunit